ncbi:MAG: molybdopterin-dependent oxidoreductase [Coriobacteriales bacterium]|jgi:anaerobic selenocysteine-containing dehydrogenase|nr:molybdopterin-dependent oxidoreductase [Coriobacteriales bacterium]
MSTRVVKSNCHYCGYLCGFLATVEDVEPCEAFPGGERLVGLEADPSRYPYDEQIIQGCRRWKMNLTEIDGPLRVNHPLRRSGERGSGTWERISWDEALDSIAQTLRTLAAEHGPATLATAIGGPHATYWPLHRFMNLWGSPNNMGIGQICWNIRIWMDALSYGWPIEVNIDPAVTEQVFLWGTNPAESDNSLFWRILLRMCKNTDIPLVVVDPRATKTARIASLHLAPRIGTDATLALALIREIISTERYDREFVERWCYGFDELTEHVEPYTLNHAQKVCGIPAADIAAAAELFSRPGPTALLTGRGIDQLGPATAPTHRAISLLRALTGDVDRPGACYIMDMSDFIPEVDLEMSAFLSEEARAAQLNEGHTALQSYSGYDGAILRTSRLGRDAPANPEGKRLPMRYLASAHPNLVWRAMLKDEEEASSFHPPYRVSALICMAANPLVTYADSQLVLRALRSLELLVVLEQYLTPTAMLADYVLPIAGALERPQFQAHGGVSNFAYGGVAALAPYYERRDDYDVFRGLGLRLGQEEYWPSETMSLALERTLAPAGMSLDVWREYGIYYRNQQWHKHEQPDEHGVPQGFATTTGKLELVNSYLQELGASPLPVPVAPQDRSTAYPLTLISGARKQPYWASSYFNNGDFRTSYPHPRADMSAATLARLGLKEGDWIRVATQHGQARFVATASPLIDDVVSVDYGWWFPEEDGTAPHLFGALRSNANMLTSANMEQCEPLIGSWTYNGIPCSVKRESS